MCMRESPSRTLLDPLNPVSWGASSWVERRISDRMQISKGRWHDLTTMPVRSATKCTFKLSVTKPSDSGALVPPFATTVAKSEKAA